MTKKTRDLTLKMLAAILLWLFSQQVAALSYTVEISEAELQEKVLQIMPIAKKTLFVSVIFSHPQIDLSVGNNQIGLDTQIDVLAPGGLKSSGRAKIKGALSYETAQGEFYFKNPQLMTMQLNDIPDAYLPSLKDMAQWLISAKLSRVLIYRLKDNDLPQSLLKYTIKSVTIEKRQLLIELSLF